jgi:hypothetical protein
MESPTMWETVESFDAIIECTVAEHYWYICLLGLLASVRGSS